MEHLFYLIVRILIVAYLLYCLFVFLFGRNRDNLWRFLTPRNTVKNNIPVVEPETEAVTHSIVGKSQTVYYEKQPERKAAAPFFSEDLKKVIPYDEEPDATDEDVENRSFQESLEDILTEEDRFIQFDADPDDGGNSSGMTYEQLNVAVNVVLGKKKGDEDCQTAARVLYEVSGSDVFNFLTAQAENEALIERLLKENIDDDGLPISKRDGKKGRNVEEFDIDKYV